MKKGKQDKSALRQDNKTTPDRQDRPTYRQDKQLQDRSLQRTSRKPLQRTPRSGTTTTRQAFVVARKRGGRHTTKD